MTKKEKTTIKKKNMNGNVENYIANKDKQHKI